MANKSRAGRWPVEALSALCLAVLGQCLLTPPRGPMWPLFLSAGVIPAWQELTGLCLLAAAGLTLWLGDRSAQPVPAPAPARKKPAIEAAVLALVVVVAIGLRLFQLDRIPNAGFRDEGENGNVAIHILKGETVEGTDRKYPVYLEANTQNATGYLYPVAAAFKAFGISIYSERLVSVFFGVLSVAGFYFLARLFFSLPLAVMLAFCLAALRWHINFSRIGFLGIMTLCLEIPLFYFLWKGLHRKPTHDLKDLSPLLLGPALGLALARGFLDTSHMSTALNLALSLGLQAPLLWACFKGLKDRRSSLLMAAGASLALALYSYIAARLLVFVVLGLIFWVVLAEPLGLKKKGRRALAGLFGSLVLAGALMVEGSSLGMPGLLLAGKVLLWSTVAVGAVMLAGWRAHLKGWVKPLSLAAGMALLVGGPIYNFSMLNFQQVFARSSRVSVFNDQEADKRPWGTKLKENIPLTMRMYNVVGDGNPRHNLPGEIMLNPGLAAVFAMGVVLCLLRFYQTRSFFFLAWWQVTLLAGYFSIEAPQAYRTIGAIPCVLLISGQALEALWRALRSWSRSRRDDWVLVVLCLFFAAGAAYEVKTYFKNQAEDPGVWAEFSASEYLMGRDLQALAPHTHAMVRPDWADSYTFKFMTYPEHDYEYFDPSRHVPLKDVARFPGKDFMYILDESYQPLLPLLKGFYPGGRYHEEKHPRTQELMYWTYWVPAAEAAQAPGLDQGLTGHYYVSDDDGKVVRDRTHHRFTRVDPFILFNWTVDPVPGHFSVEWTGRIQADKAGRYHFFTYSNDQAEVEVDGERVAFRPHVPEGNLWSEGAVTLGRGKHRLRVLYAESRSYSRIELWWQKPGGAKEVVPTSALYPE